MPFSALPDDILLPIISDAFPTAADLTDWKRLLAVLSISQQVRQLMLPKIYCDVFIMSYFEDSPSNDNTVVKTNIKLAAATGNFHFARVLNIKALYQLRQLVALESAINALTPHSGHLDHITELEVVLTYDNDCDYNAKNSIVLAEDSMVCNAERIVELVPNITSIFYYGFTRNHSTAPFYSTLISSRAGQLSRLTHHAPFDFPPFIVFSQITHLDIQLDVNNTDNLPPRKDT
ncbi:hypothetical protein H4S02_002794 [Coemansia sp. RSA 2611]|nr:hypothetical protein H4S02_002794 [Coemansia sp. RSA 2611]